MRVDTNDQTENRFRRLFENAPVGIAFIDSGARILEANTMLASMLGTNPAALEGRAFPDIVAAESREDARAALERVSSGNSAAAPQEIVLEGKAGTKITVHMHAARSEDTADIVLHFIDLSDRKALEAQFAQSGKMQAIGQLAGGIAHDFNNLLTAMIGFCDLLLLRHRPGDPSFADIMQIQQNANRAANLVRQLLAFSRQQTLRPKVQDITDILIEVSHLLRRLIGAQVELDLIHGEDLGLVRVDAGQMEQVFINLAVNARDAMPEGGKLILTTSVFENAEGLECGEEHMPPGQWIRITVRDTGCGIPEEHITRIFEPFYTTKDVGQGTGLGLATVHGIVRQTGGYLDVDSRPGEGTVFSIYLPRLSESEAVQDNEEQAEEETVRDLTGTACILLVEDEDAVRTFATRALTNKGYDVLAAAGGEEALAVLKQNEGKKPDLLVTDVMMPDMDGPSLAARLRESNPELKVVFISGYTEDRLKEHMDARTFFLPKPFTLKQLAARVKETLAE